MGKTEFPIQVDDRIKVPCRVDGLKVDAYGALWAFLSLDVWTPRHRDRYPGKAIPQMSPADLQGWVLIGTLIGLDAIPLRSLHEELVDRIGAVRSAESVTPFEISNGTGTTDDEQDGVS